MKALEKISTILLSILIALFLLSGAIACPILIRGFYYMEIKSLHLEEETGYSEKQIRDAYDEMMDYCTGGGEDNGHKFGTGELAWSEFGKSHFDDVEKLFRLDIRVLEITGAILALALILLLVFRKRFSPYRFLKRGPLFWGPVGLFIIAAILGILAAIDFDAFFVQFHHLFFPGKQNWIFDPNVDEIIRILPEQLFSNMALLILGVLIAGCIICVVLDFVIGKKKNKIQSN